MAQTEALGLAKFVLQLAGIGPEALDQLLAAPPSTGGAGLRQGSRIRAGYRL